MSPPQQLHSSHQQQQQLPSKHNSCHARSQWHIVTSRPRNWLSSAGVNLPGHSVTPQGRVDPPSPAWLQVVESFRNVTPTVGFSVISHSRVQQQAAQAHTRTTCAPLCTPSPTVRVRRAAPRAQQRAAADSASCWHWHASCTLDRATPAQAPPPNIHPTLARSSGSSDSGRAQRSGRDGRLSLAAHHQQGGV